MRFCRFLSSINQMMLSVSDGSALSQMFIEGGYHELL